MLTGAVPSVATDGLVKPFTQARGVPRAVTTTVRAMDGPGSPAAGLAHHNPEPP